jgi:hypothetical protein
VALPVDMELIKQNLSVELVWPIWHSAATDQILKAGFEETPALFDQLCSFSTQTQPVPVATASKPRDLQESFVSENGYHPARGGVGLAQPLRQIALAAVGLVDREKGEEPRVRDPVPSPEKLVCRSVEPNRQFVKLITQTGRHNLQFSMLM